MDTMWRTIRGRCSTRIDGGGKSWAVILSGIGMGHARLTEVRDGSNQAA